jgi:hypothetical protein
MTEIVGGTDASRDAVRDLVSVRGDYQWSFPPDHVSIGRRLGGGRHGAEVCEITARWATFQRRYVLKLGPAAEMRQEWDAYDQHLQAPHTLCAPIEAATPVVSNPRLKETPGRREAVVYGHVADFAGVPSRPIKMVEELASDALKKGGDTVDRLVALIALFGEKGRSMLYGRVSPYEDASTLTDKGIPESLGDWLTLQVDRVDGESLAWGTPTGEDLERQFRTSEALLRAGLLFGHDTEDECVSLGPVPVERDGNALRAKVKFLKVRIEAAGPLDGLPGQPSVQGRVIQRYADARWELIARHLSDLLREGDEVVHGSDRTFLPFARLAEMLTAPAPRRLWTLAHGDLNARNLLAVDGQPFLIDYAKTGPDQPLAADFTWLELGLLRDVLGARLEFGRLLVLQRLLGLASRAVPAMPDASAAEEALLDVLHRAAPDLETPFRLLWAVRAQAWFSYPEYDRPGWWRDYALHMAISANRTLKWSDENHEPGAVAASVAAAGAATEFWDGSRPYHRWPDGLLREAVRTLLPRTRPERPDTIRLADGLVSELDRRGRAGREEKTEITALRDRIVYATFTGAEMLLARTRRQHEIYGGTEAVGVDGSPGQEVQRLLENDGHVMLLGGPGDGKTSALRERRYQIAWAAAHHGPSPRLPLLVRADEIAGDGLEALRVAWRADRMLPPGLAEYLPALLRLGAVSVLVDDLDDRDHETAVAWMRRLVTEFPRADVAGALRRRLSPSGTGGVLNFEPFKVHALTTPDLDDIRRHLVRVLRANGAPDPDALARALIERVDVHGSTEGPGETARSLLRLLPLAPDIAKHGMPSSLPESGLADVVADYVERELGLPALRAEPGEVARARVRAKPGHEEPADDHILDAPLVRDYFDARRLNDRWREDPGLPAEWAADPKRHGACRMVVAIRDTDPGLTSALLRASLDLDLELAAGLLRASREPRSEAADEFFERTHRLLTGPGMPERVRYGRMAGDSDAPSAARVAALLALEQHRSSAGELRDAAATVLAQDDEPEVRVAALDAARRAKVTGLLPRVAELVDSAQPWPVADAAMRALRAMRAAPTQAIRARWASACTARLRASTRDLAVAGSFAEQERIKDERRRLVGELAAAGRGDLLFRHRFRFDLAAEVASVLDQAVETVPADARVVLNAPDDVARFLQHFTQGPERVATAAAHRLMRMGANGAEAMVATVSPRSPLHRLLAAAAAVTEPESVSAESVNRVVGLAASPSLRKPRRMEALAALVAAVFAVDRPRGIRLALRTGRALEDEDVPDRQRWPWTDVFGRARGLLEDLEALLCGDGDEPDLAIFGLASNAFLLDASEGPDYRFGRRARERFLDRQPGLDVPDAYRYVQAAATAGVREVARFARELARQPGWGVAPFPLATGSLGVIMYTELAGTLAAVGHLARIAERQGDRDEAIAAAELLSGFDDTRFHHSVRLGRLVGLAYLGEWRPILESYDGADPVAHRIAEHAISLWCPEPGAAVEWIETHLKVADPPADVRFTLEQWRRVCLRRVAR